MGQLEVNLVIDFVVAGLRPGDVDFYCSLRLVCKDWVARFDWKESFRGCTMTKITIGHNYLWEQFVVFAVERLDGKLVHHNYPGPAIIHKGRTSMGDFKFVSYYFCGKFTGLGDSTQ